MKYWLLFFSLLSSAEYRVFQLEVSHPDRPEEKKVILSNLDPEQYVGYYNLLPGETIVYTDTWMCRGRTNGKEFCPNPKLVPPPEEITPPSDSPAPVDNP
ncbi:MAG: hypothetical protein LW875_01960 [Proteobacteria bacterium]|jgi:hypothetical protein|nr:hypothetical protein [Pseudomonadota bacterium]